MFPILVMMRKRISIIVPVYNVEKYLERCILSIVSQDASTADYDLIVVNDGSTDCSREILEELKKKYPSIVIIDKENGGLSSARNAGIPFAKGDYIFFIDSDDWIADKSLNFLLEWINTYSADVFLFGICEIYDNGKKNYLYKTLAPDNEIVGIEDYLSQYTLRSSAWQGLFRREIFADNNILFKDGFISEDDDFVVKYFSRAKTVICNRHVVYYYYQRSDSISKGTYFEEKIIGDKLIMLEELDEYIKQYSGKLREGLQRKLDFLAVDIIRLLIRKNHSPESIRRSIRELRIIGYFPLKKASYSSKYTLFRILFSNTFAIKSARCFRKYF